MQLLKFNNILGRNLCLLRLTFAYYKERNKSVLMKKVGKRLIKL